MKAQNIALWFSLLFFTVLVFGCAQSTESVTTPSLAVPTMSISSVSPTITPVIKETPTPVLAPTTVPILPAEDARKSLLDLLASNGNCRLPCLWGITPGNSTYRETQAVLAPLTNISELTNFIPEGGVIEPIYKEDGSMLVTIVGFNIDPLSNHQIVSKVGFQAWEFAVGEPDDPTVLKPVYDSSHFGERLRPYMLSNVLSENGTPTAVLIATDGGPERGKYVPGFYILLLYPNQGILVNYTTNRELVDGNVRGCPPNAHVEMELYPPGQTELFFESLKQTDWAVKMDYYRPLEEVTSMSLEQFYETFQQPTDKCIETHANLWPTPEP